MTSQLKNNDKYIEPLSEHMTISIDGDNNKIYLNFTIYIIVILIAYLFAIQREELNTKLFLFILFFSDIYFSYIFVDWLII